MGKFRDKVSDALMDAILNGWQKRAARRRDSIRVRQAAVGGGKVTRLLVYEGDMNLRNEMDIPYKEFVVRGKDGGWEHLPPTTTADTTIRMNAVVAKGIATGIFFLPMTDGSVKEWGPGKSRGIFRASDALAWDLVEPEIRGGTGGILRNTFLFDKEMESLLNDLRLFDDKGRYVG